MPGGFKLFADGAVFKVGDVLAITLRIIEHNAGVLRVVDFQLREISLQLFYRNCVSTVFRDKVLHYPPARDA